MNSLFDTLTLGIFERDEPKVKELRTPEAVESSKKALGIANAPIPNYPTAPVAGLSDLERQAGELAGKYGTSTPEGFDYLRSIIEDTGDFTENPEIKALMDKVRRAGEEETNRVGRSLQMRGGATSSPGRDILGRSVEDTQSNILAALAPYAEAERGRKSSAAQALASLGENATLNRLNALSTQGALQRNLEQLRQQAGYERKMKELNFPYEVQAPMYARVAGMPVDWSVTQDPSLMEQIGPLLEAAGMAAMASDRRVKENILSVKGALDKIRQLNAYTYNYKSVPGVRRVGLIAQDVESVMPEAVIEIEGVKHVDTYALQSLIVQAMSELVAIGQSP